MERISLVLGSGGARGYAHIGVIEYLESNNFKIEAVSGSSMGALVGGLYCAGKLEEYKEWVLGLDLFDVIELMDFTVGGKSLIKGDKVFNKIHQMIGDIKIEDLPISFTAVATDLKRQKEVWIQKGRLIDAIRASSALPGIFPPVEINGRELIDGGVLNPVPIAPIMSIFSEKVIAVNVDANIPFKEKIEIPESILEKQGKIARYFLEFADKFSDFLSRDKEGSSFFDILLSTIDIMQFSISNFKISGYPPDILINISKDACKTLEFYKAYQMIQLGKIVAARELSKIDM